MFDHVNIKQYLLRGGAWAFSGRMLTTVMVFLLSAILARLLSPEDMGAYFLAINLAMFFSIIARMGLENTILRFVSQALGKNQFGRARVLILKCLSLGALSATLMAIIVYFLVGPWMAQYMFKSESLSVAIGFVAIWLVLLSFQFLLAEVFRGFQDIRMAVLFGGMFTSAATLVFIAAYVVLKMHAELSDVLPWVLLAGALNIALAVWQLNNRLRQMKSSKKDVSGVVYRDLVNHSWPLLISSVALFVLSQSDLWLLAAFRPDKEVAIYGATTRLVLLSGMVLTVVNAVVSPLIARMDIYKDRKRLERILRTTAAYAAIPSVLIISVYMFFGGWVLQTVFGDYYRTGSDVLVILCIGQIANVFVGSCGYTLIMTGHRHAVMLISILSAGVALACGLLLVPSYGATGVATGFAFAMVVQQLSMLIYTRYCCGIWTHADPRYLALSIMQHIRKSA